MGIRAGEFGEVEPQVIVFGSMIFSLMGRSGLIRRAAQALCAAVAGFSSTGCGSDANADSLDGASGSTRKAEEVLTGVTSVASGTQHSCALLESGKIRCWGSNVENELGGDGSAVNLTGQVFVQSPTRLGSTEVGGIENATSLDVGAHSACAVLGDHSIKCWGNNETGIVAPDRPRDERIDGAVALEGIQDAQLVSVGAEIACSLSTSGALKCWGELDDALFALELPVPAGVSAISIGGAFTALVAAGEVYDTPNQILDQARFTNAGMPAARDVAAGAVHACALLEDGSVRCWGVGLGYPHGDGRGESNSAREALPVLDLEQAQHISASFSTCAATSAGRAMCWGNLHRGKTGTRPPGSTGQGASEILDVEGVVQVANGSSHTCALLEDTSVRCWGDSPGTGTWKGDIDATPVYR